MDCRVKREGVCPTAEAWTRLAHVRTGQSSQTQQRIYNRMTENENNEGAVTVRSKSRPQRSAVGPEEDGAEDNVCRPVK